MYAGEADQGLFLWDSATDFSGDAKLRELELQIAF
jgi:hypothetical protein